MLLIPRLRPRRRQSLARWQAVKCRARRRIRFETRAATRTRRRPAPPAALTRPVCVCDRCRQRTRHAPHQAQEPRFPGRRPGLFRDQGIMKGARLFSRHQILIRGPERSASPQRESPLTDRFRERAGRLFSRHRIGVRGLERRSPHASCSRRPHEIRP